MENWCDLGGAQSRFFIKMARQDASGRAAAAHLGDPAAWSRIVRLDDSVYGQEENVI